MGGEQPIRVAVIGVGHVGEHHARLYRDLPGAELTAVCDTDAARAGAVAARHGARAVTDFRALLGKVEAVSVAVPAVSHYAVAEAFLEAGADVLVEKPIAETLEDAETLVAAARRTGRILQVGHVERFNGGVRALHALVREPGFIECHRLGPFAGRGTDVDVVRDLMIHDIDIILSLVRSVVVQVHAVGVPVISDRVDIANARLEFASGCIANVTASRVSAERLRKLRIFQRDTYLALDYATQEITCYRRRLPSPDAPPSELPRIVREEVTVDKAEPLRLEVEAFLAAIRTRSRPVVSGDEALEALRVAGQILAKI
ncbi:MAG: Gfo/Idh/MocA family oxidoreductase [candidate division NC10 bacterium]|nr:Gfo/Idh/MocA family oxidoreductase [candidate division NC10 bacterium]